LQKNSYKGCFLAIVATLNQSCPALAESAHVVPDAKPPAPMLFSFFGLADVPQTLTLTNCSAPLGVFAVSVLPAASVQLNRASYVPGRGIRGLLSLGTRQGNNI